MTPETPNLPSQGLPALPDQQNVHVAVIGMGYVGLTLALKLSEIGFQVTGVESNLSRVQQLSSGQSPIHEVGLHELLHQQLSKGLSFINEIPSHADFHVIAVGTPVTCGSEDRPPSPDLSYLTQAAQSVGNRLKRGATVIIRSTVPVGSTRSVVLPALEHGSKLKAGTDFHVVFAPERTVEGKALIELTTLPQILGGLSPECVSAASRLFQKLSPKLVPMESLEATELAKLLNNSFRDYVFAFANQVAQLASPYNLDVARCIKNANDGYPRDTIPLPSPGVGGPCLTKDPWIFASLAQQNIGQTLSAHARRANDSMIDFVVTSLCSEWMRQGKSPNSVTVIACGMAFKGRPETGDLRNSTSVDIVRKLTQKGIRVLCHDPVATESELGEFDLIYAGPPADWKSFDALLLLNNHKFYTALSLSDVLVAMRPPGILYDAWGILNPDQIKVPKGSVVYMGLGFVREF